MEFAIVVPTMGLSHVKELCQSIIENWRGRGLLVLSFNPKDTHMALLVKNECDSLLKAATESMHGFEYKIIYHDHPLGFGAAVNVGLRGIPNLKEIKQVIILNDDCIVTSGWREGLWNGHITNKAQTAHQSMTGKEQSPIGLLGGPVGLVSACSFNVSGEQNIGNEGNLKAFEKMGIKEFSRQYKLQLSNQYLRADFISGFVLSIENSCFWDLVEETEKGICLFDERFLIGGFEDNDLCYRATKAGYQMLIAKDTFIHHLGHKSFGSYYPEALVGLHNRDVYYNKWKEETQRDQKLVAAYRLAIKCVNDLVQFRSSVKKAIGVGVKGFAILLTNNPKELLDSYDKNLLHSLPPEEKKFAEELIKCQDQEAIIEKFEDYITILTGYVEANLGYTDWKSFNERKERNRTHELAEEMGADWIISIDSDEVIEDRITKEYMDRLMKHPDPLVMGYHTGWINHWETMNLVRTDKPFTSGPDLKASMIGVRMWKTRKNPLRIVSGTDNGLHCGNAPEYSPYTIRVAGFRFRHLSHVRGVDRIAKKIFYDNIDQSKESIFIGQNDGYNHIVQRDDVVVQLFNPANGIAGFMLCYEEEETELVAQKLELMYSVCDYAIIVWTSKEEKSEKLLSLAAHYKAIWLHKEFDHNVGLSECRNAAVDYIRENLLQKGVSWALFYDPDEMLLESPHVHNASIRRCAELNDSWGISFTFKNKLPKGSTLPVSNSSSIRMFRVDQQGIMRFSGRVHESLDDSLTFLQNQNINPLIKTFPYNMLNLGLSKDPEAMKKKLLKYTEMLVNDLEQNPLRSQCWLALGLQYVNEGDMEKAEICMERSCMTAGGAYMPFKELATIQINKTLALILKSKERLNGGESVYWPGVDDLIKVITKVVPPHPIINTGPKNIIEDLELPFFPYDRITVNEEGDFIIIPEQQNEE